MTVTFNIICHFRLIIYMKAGHRGAFSLAVCMET